MTLDSTDEPVREISADGPVGRGIDLAAGLAQTLTHRAAGPARRMAQVAMRPPLVPQALSPARAVHDLTVRARRVGDSSAEAAAELFGTMLDAQVPKIADAVLARLDLRGIVEAVLERIDLTELARDRIDLAQLASEVIDEIDLPSIIRESSTGVASDVVTGARASAATADEAVARFLARRRNRRRDRADEEGVTT